jgi:ABC-type polysaccharide/polyol phosphate transport system ATPase subunit
MRLLHHETLPDGVLLSVEGVSKTPPRPMPQPPPWLAKVLPGVQLRATTSRDEGMDEEDEDDDYDAEEREGVALKPISFQLQEGSGLGIVGPDFEAIQALFLMLAGYYPPSDGRVVVRGRIAPVFKPALLNVFNRQGKKALDLTSRLLNWPKALVGDRWPEIVEFAALDEVEFPPGTFDYDHAATRRIMVSAALHLDATVYLVAHKFMGGEGEFSERCYGILAERQRQGCAIVHSGFEVEHVGRLCHEAIWIEDGAEVFRGRLGEVASAAAKRKAEQVAAERVVLPVRAVLLSASDVVVSRTPAVVDLELDVFGQDLELEVDLALTSEALGEEMSLRRPKRFVSKDPGVYRLSVSLPGGLLDEGTYAAEVRAWHPDTAERPQVLASFTVRAEEPEDDEFENGPVYGIVGDEFADENIAQVEWNVSRVAS